MKDLMKFMNMSKNLINKKYINILMKWKYSYRTKRGRIKSKIN